MTDKKNSGGDVIEFENNPYSQGSKKPEDVMRIFYGSDQALLPVVSKRGILIGIIRKKDAVSQMSDIGRIKDIPVDKFITGLAIKMSVDEVLEYGKVREYEVVNIFGEITGSWSRLRLFSAIEPGEAPEAAAPPADVSPGGESQTLEWLIFSLLEHIPRALYALNKNGKTFFYNSLFEDLYLEKIKSPLLTDEAEALLADPDRNELLSGISGASTLFYNDALGISYEKVPMYSSGKKTGYLIFCVNESEAGDSLHLPGGDYRNSSLPEILDSLERQIIIDVYKKNGDVLKTAESLQITKKALLGKMNKYDISTES